MRRLIFAVAAVMAAELWGDVYNDALDNHELNFDSYSHSGSDDTACWGSQIAYSRYGGSAARSGECGNSQTNGLCTTVAGPGTVSFFWGVSSEKDHDWLEFLVDGTVRGRISGVYTNSEGRATVRLTAATYVIKTDGMHELEWRYCKDKSGKAGDDAGYVDYLKWKPLNDDFASATAISGEVGSALGSTVGAGVEKDEPDHAAQPTALNSVWWVWTAPATGEFAFDTIGSTGKNGNVLDTVIGVYTGSSVASLTEIVSNNDIDSEIDERSLCRFTAQSGKKYYIAVAAYGNAAGTVRLNWSPWPQNDGFNQNILLPSAVSGSVRGINYRATFQDGEPYHNGNTSATNSVWWAWQAPCDGMATFSTANSTFDTVMGVYKAKGWSTLDNLERVTSNDDSTSSDKTSRCRFNARAGTIYFIAVAGYGGRQGVIVLSWSMDHPANDDFANATVLVGEYGRATGTTVDASAEPGEPLPVYKDKATNTVWWAWTAPASGNAVFHTTNSALDTVMGVYTGTDVNNLTTIAQNDDVDFPNNSTSLCTFDAVGGTKYYIVVSGYGNRQGEVDLRWTLSPVAGKYTLTRDPNGGAFGGKTTATVNKDGLQTGKSNYWSAGIPTRTGYAFDGWWTKASSGVQVYGPDGNCTVGAYWDPGKHYVHEGDLTVYAHWRAISGKKYTLTRDPNGGTYSGKTAATVNKDGLQTGKSNYWSIGVPTRSGFTFDGWWTKTSSGVKVYDASGNCIAGAYWDSAKHYVNEGDLTVYAHWKAVSSMVVSGNRVEPRAAEEAAAPAGWAVGTFDGAVLGESPDGGTCAAGAVTLTVSADGGISGKIMEGGRTWTLASPALEKATGLQGAYRAAVTSRCGELEFADEVVLTVDELARGVVSGDGWVAWQNVWKAEPWKSAAEPFADAPVLVTPDGVELRFSSSGAVTAKLGAYSCSSVLIPVASPSTLNSQPSTLNFSLYLYFPPKADGFEGYAVEIELVWDGTAFSQTGAINAN